MIDMLSCFETTKRISVSATCLHVSVSDTIELEVYDCVARAIRSFVPTFVPTHCTNAALPFIIFLIIISILSVTVKEIPEISNLSGSTSNHRENPLI